MAKTVRIALAQMAAKCGDVDANIKNALLMIDEASQASADIVLLPELCFTGYQMQILGKEILRLSDQYADVIDQSMRTAARDGNVNIIAGLCIDENGHYYNAARLYDRTGTCSGEYRKTFSFGNEGDYFDRGEQLPVFKTDFGKIGILICYDIGFPETARLLSKSGAQIIFIPAAWRIQDELSWNLNVPSRALENQLFTAAVNHCCKSKKLHLFGRSMICGPDGRSVLQLGYDKQMLGICDVNLEEIDALRTQPGYWKDYLSSNILK